MKTPLAFTLRFLALAATLVGGATAAHAQAQPFPIGTWDCSISERQFGLAILRFDADFTFNGIQLMRPATVNKPAPTPNPRNGVGDTGRGGVITPKPDSTSTTNFVGGTVMGGLWGYDDTGKVIGLLDQITSAIELVSKTVTNFVGGTNLVYTTNVYELVFKTNSVSFRTSGVAGQRITLASYLPDGTRNIYRGGPSIPLADLSGEYYGTGKRSNIPYVEFFDLVPDGSYPNLYTVAGAGAGYGFDGYVILSRQGKIAVYTSSDREPYPLTVHSGPFNATTRRGTINGRDSSGNKYSFRLVHR